MKITKPKVLITVLTAVVILLLPIVALSADIPAPVAKTGQTTSYRTGDDGDYENGVASPSPRFTDNGDETVTDNLTGLMWAKDADHGETYWFLAINYANYLSLGNAGCGTSYTDWRLPNIKELLSLIDYTNFAPALPAGHPFTSVDWVYYWSSTTTADPNQAWLSGFKGYTSDTFKSDIDYTNVWPVR